MLRTLQGVDVPVRDGVFVLGERVTYVCTASVTAQVRLGVLSLTWSREHSGWLVPVSYWAADQVLYVREGGTEASYRVRAEPEAEKLTPKEWVELLDELDAWWPAVVGGREGGEHGGHNTRGVPLALLAPALAGSVRALLASVRELLARPRAVVRHVEEFRRLHTIRRANAPIVRWLSSHPDAQRQMNWQAEQRGQDLQVLSTHAAETLDQPAHRFLIGQLRRVMKSLHDNGTQLLAMRDELGGLTDAVAWTHARGTRCCAAANALKTTLEGTWLSQLPSGEVTASTLSMLAGDPVYRRVHRLCGLLLRPRWLATAEAAMPVRPTYSLFELWAFLRVARWLEAALPGMRGRWRRLDRLTSSRTGSGAEWRAESPRGCVRLCFNARFSGWSGSSAAQIGPRFSLTRGRRPDLALCVSRAGSAWWAVIDAKYRVAHEAIEDAFASVHIYRDSLRWPDFGGACAGGFLLVPRMERGTEAWFSEEFHRLWSMGAFTARPGQASDSELPVWIAKRLAELLG